MGYRPFATFKFTEEQCA